MTAQFTDSPRAIPGAKPSFGSPEGTQATETGQGRPGAHITSAGLGSNSLVDQVHGDAQTTSVSEGSAPQGSHNTADAHSTSAALGPILWSPTLGLAAEVVDDLEKVRIANENRLRQLTRSEVDADGEERGFGLSLDHPDVKRLDALVKDLQAADDRAVKNLQKTMRDHPLWAAWGKDANGVGEKQLARLLAAIGDPYWHDHRNTPRTVSELWAYAGYRVMNFPAGHGSADAHRASASRDQTSPISHPDCDTQVGLAGGGQTSDGHTPNDAVGTNVHPADHISAGAHRQNVGGVAQRRQKGQKSNWSATAKMRAYLIAESCVKRPKGTRYRDVYDRGREKYDGAMHAAPCQQCAGKGKSAEAAIGAPLRPGHQHARALRLVAKEVLKDLWVASKEIHEKLQQQEANRSAKPRNESPLAAA